MGAKFLLQIPLLNQFTSNTTQLTWPHFWLNQLCHVPGISLVDTSIVERIIFLKGGRLKDQNVYRQIFFKKGPFNIVVIHFYKVNIHFYRVNIHFFAFPGLFFKILSVRVEAF